MNNFIQLILVIVLLGIVMVLTRFLHELSHFLLLKMFNVKIKSKKLLGWTGNGGYVEADPNEFNKIERWKRVAVSVSGLITDLLFYGILASIYFNNYHPTIFYKLIGLDL